MALGLNKLTVENENQFREVPTKIRKDNVNLNVYAWGMIKANSMFIHYTNLQEND